MYSSNSTSSTVVPGTRVVVNIKHAACHLSQHAIFNKIIIIILVVVLLFQEEARLHIVSAARRTMVGSIHNKGIASGNPLCGIVEQQLQSLDNTDAYASVWKDLLSSHDPVKRKWGGRGKGGRGRARHTYQPRNIVVNDVHLQYVGVQSQGRVDDAKRKQIQLPSKVLLEGATLKLESGHIYALVGRNGCGKSTLLRRIQAGLIPGFPPHVTTLYIPQELQLGVNTDTENDAHLSVLQVVIDNFTAFAKSSSISLHCRMELIEQELECLQDTDEEKMGELCEELSELQESIDRFEEPDGPSKSSLSLSLQERISDSLRLFGIEEDLHERPFRKLSPGQRKRVALSFAALSSCMIATSQHFLLCLDEPTNHLDIEGLLLLRQFLGDNAQRTVLLVSHDLDLLNDVATNIIVMANKTLFYFPGTYEDFLRITAQQGLHYLRQQLSLDKKRNHMVQTIHHLQAQPAPRRGGNRKKAKMISAQRKKLERQGIEKDENGHRWTQQRAGTGIKPGSLNGIDASARKDLSAAELLKLAETSVRPPPDKAVQFV